MSRTLSRRLITLVAALSLATPLALHPKGLQPQLGRAILWAAATT